MTLNTVAIVKIRNVMGTRTLLRVGRAVLANMVIARGL